MRDQILADVQRPTVITSAGQVTGLLGLGGIGKSVLPAPAAYLETAATGHPILQLFVAT